MRISHEGTRCRNGGEALRPREAERGLRGFFGIGGRNGGEALRPREVTLQREIGACLAAAMEARPYGLAKAVRVREVVHDPQAAMEARPYGLAKWRLHSRRRTRCRPQWRRGLTASRSQGPARGPARGPAAAMEARPYGLAKPQPSGVLPESQWAAMEARPYGLAKSCRACARRLYLGRPQWRRGLTASRSGPHEHVPGTIPGRNGGEALRPREVSWR